MYFLIIYSNYEVREFSKTKEIEERVQSRCVQKDENALKNDACITNNQKESNKKSTRAIGPRAYWFMI